MDLVLLLDSYCGSQEWEPTPMISTHIPEGGGAMDCGTVCTIEAEAYWLSYCRSATDPQDPDSHALIPITITSTIT